MVLPLSPRRCSAEVRQCRSCIQEMRVVENRRDLLSSMDRCITWNRSAADEITADTIAMEITDIVDIE